MMLRRLFEMPEWSWKTPFMDMEKMRREMDRLNEIMLRGTAGLRSAGVFPPVNVTEDKEKYYIRAELPGMKSENLDIQATGKNISISGERMIPAEGENVKYHRRERESGRFSRVITMPGEIQSDKVEADLSNGILTVKAPKSEAVKPRQIIVK